MLVDMASRNVERLDRLMGDLLDVERIETGTEVLLPGFIAVDELFARAAARTRARLAQDGLTLATHADPVELWIDAGRIEQVVVNLIGNAANFAPAGSTITLTARDEGDAVRVAVRDEGRGIPADMLESVFEPFVKVDGGETAPGDMPAQPASAAATTAMDSVEKVKRAFMRRSPARVERGC